MKNLTMRYLSGFIYLMGLLVLFASCTSVVGSKVSPTGTVTLAVSMSTPTMTMRILDTPFPSSTVTAAPTGALTVPPTAKPSLSPTATLTPASTLGHKW